jgi:hypothetical protein
MNDERIPDREPNTDTAEGQDWRSDPETVERRERERRDSGAEVEEDPESPKGLKSGVRS